MKNILYIVVDCLRADVCYGNKGDSKTPHIDGLRRRGSTFTRMMSVATMTTPSVASMLTGSYPVRHGVRTLSGFSISSKVRMLQELLKEAGYRTAAFACGPLLPDTGIPRGFDEFEFRSKEDTIYGPWGDAVAGRLNKLKEPWFAYLHIWELHRPRRVDTGFGSPDYGRTDYERALSSIDATLGRWLGQLDMNDTVIMLTGDHGENYQPPLVERIKVKLSSKLGLKLKADRRYPKGGFHGYNVFDFLINVPFVIAGPGIPEGVAKGLLSSHIDVAPTVLDLAGAARLIPEGMHGRSLMPAVMGENLPPREAYLEACGMVIPSEKDWLRGVRTDSWKFIFAPKNPSIEPLLFDLSKDPGEAHNLAAKKPDVAARMKAMILEFDKEAEMILKGEAMSGEEEKAVEDRLRELGYL